MESSVLSLLWKTNNPVRTENALCRALYGPMLLLDEARDPDFGTPRLKFPEHDPKM